MSRAISWDDPLNIEALLRAAPMTAEDLAWKVGTTPRTVQRWRAGESSPRPHYWRKLDDAVDELKGEPLTRWDAIQAALPPPDMLAVRLQGLVREWRGSSGA